MQVKSWHNLTANEVLSHFKVNPQKGLSFNEAEKRLKKYGLNQLQEIKKETVLSVFLRQFNSPLIYILILAGLIILFLRIWTDAIVIFIAVLVNALFGFWEENKVSNIIQKLKKVLKTPAIVLREGVKKVIYQENLVPGDIIILEPGRKVPADGRLIAANNLKISEAALTGEWVPARKNIDPLPEDTPLADRSNMVFMGTMVEEGDGMAVITETGMQTEIGKIAKFVQVSKKEKSPLQKKLIGFSKFVGSAIVLVATFIFVLGYFRGENVVEFFETSVAIAVGGVPEALPIVMTVILAIGAERLLKKKGLIKKLIAVEILGSAQVICTDKTKTLTLGQMEVSEIVSEDELLALKCAVLANETFIENPEDSPRRWKLQGSSTGKALIMRAAKDNILKPQLDKEYQEILKVPFSSEYKYQLSLRSYYDDNILFALGAPEILLEKSKHKGYWLDKLTELLKEGRRIVGVAMKKLDNIPKEAKELHNYLQELEFLGLIALKDPLRPGVKEAMNMVRESGVRTIIVTGDHKLTAVSITKELGIAVKEDEVLEGKDLDKLSDNEFDHLITKVKIYARVEPKHKLRIISALQTKGYVVAMIGDGVNDAPALKKADIGVALGSGTEIAKEASELVLLDDSFATIVQTIKEGRVILDNIRKAISYVMVDSFASAVIVGFASIFGWPLPILPVQILWNNIIEDSFPNLAFAFESPQEDVMKRPPNPAKVPLLTKEMKAIIFGAGIIYQFFGLALFWIIWKELGLSLDYARTMVFGLLVLNTAFVIFAFKNLKQNITKYNLFSNKILNLAVLAVLVFFVFSIYLPFFQKLLKTVPLGIGSILILIFLSLSELLLVEITKYLFTVQKFYKR